MPNALSISPATQPIAPPAPRGIAWIEVTTAAHRSGLNRGTIARTCATKWFAMGLARQLGGAWQVREDADVRFARVRFADDLPADLTRIIHPLPCANGLRVVNCFYHEELTNTGGHGWWRRVLSS